MILVTVEAMTTSKNAVLEDSHSIIGCDDSNGLGYSSETEVNIFNDGFGSGNCTGHLAGNGYGPNQDGYGLGYGKADGDGTLSGY